MNLRETELLKLNEEALTALEEAKEEGFNVDKELLEKMRKFL